MRMTYAQKVIAQIDPGINPVGVEEHMRAHFGTLDHLSHAEFVAETKLARTCEEQQPGYLRQCAFCDERSFDEWQREHGMEDAISRIHVAKPQIIT